MKTRKTYPLLAKNFNDISYTVLENGFLTADSSWYYPNMISPYNRMYFFIDGEVEIRGEREIKNLVPGYVYLIPANTSYDYICHSTMEKFYIHFELQALPGLDMFQELDRILELPYDTVVLDMIRVYATDESFGGLLHLKAFLLEYAAKFFTIAQSSTDFLTNYAGYHNQREVLAYIDANLSTQLKVEEIAQALNRSISNVSRSFKQDVGVGIKRYIETQILRKSKQLLMDKNMSIAEIADRFDFCDAYYFSRFFKKFEQMPPREYRKRFLWK